MVPYRLSLIALGASALLACSASDGSGLDRDTGANGTDTGPDEDDLDSDGDTDVPVVPSLFGLDATVTIASGVVDPASTTVDVGFWTRVSGTPELLCARAPATLDVTEAGVVDDVPLYGWWALSLQADGADECTWAVPEAIHVGIGALDSRLYPAMEAHDYDTDATSPYGAYVAYGSADAPVFVYGVAGTEAILAGTEPAADTTPLADGTYRIVGLHLLPLPE